MSRSKAVRKLYGFLDREGCRVHEATTLDWRDLELVHGEIHLDENKTDDPRSWALGDDTAEALRRWRDHFHPNPKSDVRVFIYPETSREAGEEIDGAARAEEFRENLRKAGIERANLFLNTASRRHICVHDLRATFVTLALSQGRSETWVSDRTGHRSSHQIRNYLRQARTHSELKRGALAPLHEAIPELRAAVPDVTVGGTSGERLPQGENHMQTDCRTISGGEGGIRTRGTLAGAHDFQSCTFGHSVTSPIEPTPEGTGASRI